MNLGRAMHDQKGALTSGPSPTSGALTKVIVYAAGCCLNNPGPGGWGAVFSVGGQLRERSGAEILTTNNRMQITAAIEALNRLPRPCHVVLYNNSDYVPLGMTEWISGWKKRAWMSSAGVAVKNKDLWLALEEAVRTHRVDWLLTREVASSTEAKRARALSRHAASRVA
jgi:ribonuclease HI